MKQLHSELSITKTELLAKEEALPIAEEFILKHMPKIKGIAKIVKVTHSWGKLQMYADPNSAYTAMAMTQSKVSLQACAIWCKKIKTLFKNVGDPVIYHHKKGMILTIGFTVNLKKMQQLEELFG